MQVDLGDRTNRPTRLDRSTATHCTGPFDLVTNPPRHNGSIVFESALIPLLRRLLFYSNIDKGAQKRNKCCCRVIVVCVISVGVDISQSGVT